LQAHYALMADCQHAVRTLNFGAANSNTAL